MDRIKKEEYKNIFLIYLLASAVMFIGLYVPLVFIAAPFILVYSVARFGPGFGGGAALLSIITLAFFDLHMAYVLAAAFLPSAFVTGYMIRSKKRLFISVAASCAAALAGAALSIGVIMALTGKPVVDGIVAYAGANMYALGDQYISSLYQMVRYVDVLTGAITQEALLATPAVEAVKNMQTMLNDTLQLWFITIVGIYALLGGLLYYTIPRSIAKKNVDVAPNPLFSEYALPKGFWIAFAVSYLFAMAGAGFGWKSFDIIEITVYNLYAFVFSVQALSFLDFMYRKRNMGTGARTMMHVLSVLILSFVLFWIGIFENIFSLRKRMDERQV